MRGCGATLIGDRVTSNSGRLVGRDPCVGPYCGAVFAGGAGGGGGGSGGGAALVATSTASALVGAVGVTDDVPPSRVLLPGRRTTSSTPDTTIAAMAAEVAMIAARAGLVRYHGVGGGVKLQVLTLNASKRPLPFG